MCIFSKSKLLSNPLAKPRPDKILLKPGWASLAALCAGASAPLAFSPFNLFPLGVLAPAILFWLWLEASPPRAAWYGFVFGFAMFAFGVSWVYVSMHNFGNMEAPLAAFAVILFAACLALYPALVGWLQAHFFRARGVLFVVLALPALWVLFEWIRGWFLSGFPWLNLGYSQIDTPLAGFAPWLGVYGVSLAAAVSAGLLIAAWRARRRTAWIKYAALFIAIWLSGWLVRQIDWVESAGEPLRVALVQGNVALRVKWVPEFRSTVIQNYLALSRKVYGADLVVWPESAVPGYLDELTAQFVPQLKRVHRDSGTDFLIGVVEKDRESGAYYNSVVSIGSAGGAYRKRHLVPFGEFLPFPSLFQWFIDRFQIPMSNFTPGLRTQPALEAVGQPVGVSVCYEDAFGAEVIKSLPQATLLVNVSEDAWFGDSLGPHQRLQMARMRALEAARPMLRAANTGPSAIIDHEGRLRARSPQFKQTVLTGSIQRTQGATPYVRFGDWPVVAIVMSLIVAVLRLTRVAPES